jgi:hypothetical protein
MKFLKTLSFIIYLLVGIIGFVFAYFYLFRPEFMPYHADAVGMSWEQVGASTKVLILALMRVSGGGWLSTSTSIIFLLIARKRFQWQWFNVALVLVGLSALIPTLYATLYVRMNSPANPPWIAAVIGIGLLLAGLIMDLIAGKRINKPDQ